MLISEEGVKRRGSFRKTKGTPQGKAWKRKKDKQEGRQAEAREEGPF